MTKWIEGPPTTPGNYVTKCRGLNEDGYCHWNQADIDRQKELPGHITHHYGPIPDPPKPLKLFRLFNCTTGDQRGTGAYDPNGNFCPYKIHWEDKFYETYSQSEIDEQQIKIDWIDNA